MPGEDFFEFREKLKARPAPPATAAREQLSVTQLTRMIETAIQKLVPASVLVSGELSNVNLHRASGHLYFTLKDANCCIECVMWKSDAARLKFDPTDGEAVLVSGAVQVYGVRGRYQLYAKSIEPIGKGALELAFRKLYAKLEAEGLFSPQRKRAIPKFPMRIALITSRNGAALADMLKVLRRFAWIKLDLLHVAVQGDAAAQQIAAALHPFSRETKSIALRASHADLIILARGGGSLEDLWSFNEEVVARAIVASRIPVVTGIGHEVDTSIADLVADYHAHTPTEAAQVVVANWRTAASELDASALRLRRAMSVAVNHTRQRLDDRQRALTASMRENLRRLERTIESRDARLRQFHPRHQLRLMGEKMSAMEMRVATAVRAGVRRRAMRIDSLDAHLQAISPKAVLGRGYSITAMKRGGKIVRSVTDVREGDELITRLSDGEIESTVEDQKQHKLF